MVSTFKRSTIGIVSAAFAIAGLVAVSPAQAATSVDINIPVTTVIRGDVGSAHQLASEPVDPDYRGMICDVKAVAQNQHSIHPGNNLVVASGTDSVVLEDVERDGGSVTNADGELTLGETLTVTLVMGQDKVFSAGMDVKITCEDPPKEIEVCRDGEIITITDDLLKPTDTTDLSKCEPEEETKKVCRDGEIVEINVSEMKDTDTDVASCDEEEPEEPKVLGKELPNTGPGAAVMTVLSMGGLGATVRAWISSKKNVASSLLNK